MLVLVLSCWRRPFNDPPPVLPNPLSEMWTYLDMVRVYTKPKGSVTDFSSPVILTREKRSVEDFCNRIHKQILKNLKSAWVWGASVRHQPQRVGKDHMLEDEDVIQLVKRI